MRNVKIIAYRRALFAILSKWVKTSLSILVKLNIEHNMLNRYDMQRSAQLHKKKTIYLHTGVNKVCGQVSTYSNENINTNVYHTCPKFGVILKDCV